MDLTSFPFMIFAVVFFSLYYFIKEKHRNLLIALSSLFIYGAWYPPALIILLYFVIITKIGGQHIHRSKSTTITALYVFLCLSVLFVFKYLNFFASIFPSTHIQSTLILPIGISFYTFTVIAYLIDVYRKEIPPIDSWLSASILVSFWPHLAAGPILKAKNIVANIWRKEKFSWDIFLLAGVLITTGLSKKMYIADNLGAYVNANLASGISNMSSWEALATLFGFAGQIYADFSGYSDAAIGLALLIGFRLPANFNYPYSASTLTDFWHRWHISLSTWFRDYLFIPLGGSRRGKTRTLINLLLVFAISGLWHGAAWNFLVWGSIHGLVLVLEKLLGKRYLRVPPSLRWIATICVVTISWAYFRLSVADANLIISRIFSTSLLPTSDSAFITLPIVGLMLFVFLEHVLKTYQVDKGYPVINLRLPQLIFIFAIFSLALILSGRPLPFIYFQF